MTPIVQATKVAPSAARSAVGFAGDGESVYDERLVCRFSFVTDRAAELEWMSRLPTAAWASLSQSFHGSGRHRGEFDHASRVADRMIVHSVCT